MTTTIIVSGVSLAIGFITGGAVGIRAGYMKGLADVEHMIEELPKK